MHDIADFFSRKSSVTMPLATKRTKDKFCLEKLKPFLETTGHSFDSVIDECLKLKDEVGYSTAPSRRTWNNAVSPKNGVTLTQATKIDKLLRTFFEKKYTSKSSLSSSYARR